MPTKILNYKCATQQKFNRGIEAGNITNNSTENKFETTRECVNLSSHSAPIIVSTSPQQNSLLGRKLCLRSPCGERFGLPDFRCHDGVT